MPDGGSKLPEGGSNLLGFLLEKNKNLGFSVRETGNVWVFIEESTFLKSKTKKFVGQLVVVGITFFIVPIKEPRRNWEISGTWKGAFPDGGSYPPCP